VPRFPRVAAARWGFPKGRGRGGHRGARQPPATRSPPSRRRFRPLPGVFPPSHASLGGSASDALGTKRGGSPVSPQPPGLGSGPGQGWDPGGRAALGQNRRPAVFLLQFPGDSAPPANKNTKPVAAAAPRREHKFPSVRKKLIFTFFTFFVLLGKENPA